MKSDASEVLIRKKKEFTKAGVPNVQMGVSIGNPVKQILAIATDEKARSSSSILAFKGSFGGPQLHKKTKWSLFLDSCQCERAGQSCGRAYHSE